MPTATPSRRKTHAVTVRNLPPEVHRALKLRAKEHGISTEAEIRLILKSAVEKLKPSPKISLAEALYMPGADDIELDIPNLKYTPLDIDWT